MNNFDQMFSEAVKILLEQKAPDKTGKEDKKSDTAARPPASQVIVWRPGKGDWGDVIKGIKKDAEVSYEEAISKSSALGAKSMSLMGKLSITKESKSRDPLEATGEILRQAISSPVMSRLYGPPNVSENAVTVPIRLSMNEDDVKSGEGILGRNATVFIHLTLIGAYNARMFMPTAALVIQTASPERGAIIIKKA